MGNGGQNDTTKNQTFEILPGVEKGFSVVKSSYTFLNEGKSEHFFVSTKFHFDETISLAGLVS